MKIDLTWAEFKDIISKKNIFLQYQQTTRFYKIWAQEGQILYATDIFIDNPVTLGSDQEDFETNYKSNANKPIQNLKTTYISKIINVFADENVFDLGSTYIDFTIIVTGSKNIILKLNDSDNDEIPLSGGQNIRDIIGADFFELNKIYCRTEGSGDESQILLWAMKQ